MRTRKERLTVTLDRAVAREGARAVASGRAVSFSAWVNQALLDRLAHERRLHGLGEAIADYEREFGVITDEELSAQRRKDRANAIIVRGKAGARSPRRRGVA
jgi:hypothetical protein